MKRWIHLLPRLGVLFFAALIVYLLSGSVLRQVILQTAQSFTDSRVEFGKLSGSLGSGQIQIDEIQIADPRQPMQNILQAESGQFQINPEQLLRRRWVIDYAQLDQVQFGTPRTEPGFLPRNNGRIDAPRSTLIASRRPSTIAAAAGKRWANQLQARLPTLIESDLETSRIAKRIREQWPDLFQPHRAMAIDLKQRARKIQQGIGARAGNPLRNFERFQISATDTRQLLTDFEDARHAIGQLSARFQSDQQSLIAAHHRDRARIRQVSGRLEISPDEVSGLLLDEQKLRIERKLCRWLKWFRETAPGRQAGYSAGNQRGFDLQFRRYPEFLFRQLDFNGEGTFLETATRFSGSLHHFSDSPQIVSEPISFEICTEGEYPIRITGLVDRRGPQKIDTLAIFCPRMSRPSRLLGSPKSLSIELEPGHMRFELDVRLVDNDLSGNVLVRHTGVELNVTGVHPLAGGPELLDQLDRRASEIGSFDMRIELGGTLQNPKTVLRSDLGDPFAAAMEVAFHQRIQRSIASQTARLETVLDRHVTALNKTFTDNTDELLELLNLEVAIVAGLEDRLRAESDATQRIR